MSPCVELRAEIEQLHAADAKPYALVISHAKRKYRRLKDWEEEETANSTLRLGSAGSTGGLNGGLNGRQSWRRTL